MNTAPIICLIALNLLTFILLHLQQILWKQTHEKWEKSSREWEAMCKKNLDSWVKDREKLISCIKTKHNSAGANLD